MKPKSSIEKGKRLENWICDQIRECGLDSTAGREVGSGSGQMKGDIRTSIPFIIEAKNMVNKNLRIMEAIDQAKKQASIGSFYKSRWAMIFNDSRFTPEFTEVYAIIDFQEFLELLKRAKEPKIKEPDRAVTWKIKNLIQSAKALIKELE